MEREVAYAKLPWGIWLVEKCNLCRFLPSVTPSYKAFIFILTFFIYVTYHLSRKPFSVIKVSLCPVCAHCDMNESYTDDFNITPGWPPFNNKDYGRTLMGSVDYTWLFSYAIALYFSGIIADRLNLRYFLTTGMLGSGLSVCLLGVAYFAQIHHFAYFVVVQIFGGIMQSTGWPGSVAVMTHWFGKHNRGLIMGIWNSHTSVGNILGAILPSFWATCNEKTSPWGWSFFLPGFITLFIGVLIYLFLVTDPVYVGVPPPIQHLEDNLTNLDNRTHSAPHSKHEGDDDQLLADTDETTGLIEEDREGEEISRPQKEKAEAINFFRAFMIPGVMEFSLALFFNKLVSYSFLYWLPFYIKVTRFDLTGPESSWLSTIFDFGGIAGGIIVGFVSDLLNARAITCAIMLLLAIPLLAILDTSRDTVLGAYIILLFINGSVINSPLALITTAVSSDLGTHPSLKANTNAKATVTAIIDGTGSLGAAVGPLLVGVLSDQASWAAVFYFLMASSFISALCLSRLVIKDTLKLYQGFKNYRSSRDPPVKATPSPIELQRLKPLSDNLSPSENESETTN